MTRISMIAASAMLFLSCGASLKRSREAESGMEGLMYCEAKKSKNAVRADGIAKKYRLVAEDWDSYCDAMESQNYSRAFDIARRKHLGRTAVRKAGFAYMWDDIENGFVFVAHMTGTRMDLSDSERLAFGSAAFGKVMRARGCIKAVEIARFFDLTEAKSAEALACVEKERGLTVALVYACLNDAPDDISVGYKSRFLAELPERYAETVRASDFREAVKRCDWNRGDLEGLLIFLRGIGDFTLALTVLDELRLYLPEKERFAIARSLFDQAIADSRPEEAEKVREAFPKALDVSRKTLMLDIFLSRRKCPEALAFTFKDGLSDATVEKVFTSPMCRGSEFDRFAWVLAPYETDAWRKYFFLAVKYKRFMLARTMADKASEGRKNPDEDLYAMLVGAALMDNAHELLLEMEPPPNETQEAYKARIFEHALSHGEEWRAATYAGAHHPNPESVIERAYLRAMERGAIILAAQIAKTYGDPKRLEGRARLAFEMALLAERPRDAQFIMRVTGLKDPERRRRAALMRYRQKRAKDRKARREKKRRERKRKRDSGDWSVRRD